MISHCKVLHLLALITLALSLAGCQSKSPPAVTPSATASAIAPTAPGVNFSPAPASTEVLSACDLDLQSAAMRPENISDWTSMGISTCYDLAFDLSTGGPDFSGSAVLTFTNPGQTALEDMVLRLYPNAPLLFGGRLEITSARVDQIELEREVFLEDHTAVRLVLVKPLNAAETLHLTLDFNGTLPAGFTTDDIYGTFFRDTQGPVLMMANAYPLLAPLENGIWRADPVLPEGDAVVSQVALYRAAVQVPADWQVVSSGSAVNTVDEGASKQVQIAGGPLREFMLAASPAFELEQRTRQDVKINHWGLPDSADYRTEVLQTAEDAMEIFTETFGPYPYQELDIIAARLNNASGVEYPGLVLLGESLYPSQSSPRMLPFVTAHEIAHQWWYAVVGNDVLEHPWQDEALATYSAQLYLMAHDPTFYLGAINLYRQRVSKLEAEQGVQPIDQSVAELVDTPDAYSTIAYLKGDLFFEALREEIGVPNLNAALQSYYQTYSYRIAPPSGLLDSFESACQCQLDALYAHWGLQP